MIRLKFFLLTTLIVLSFNNCFSQINKVFVLKQAAFTEDSLKGFEEEVAIRSTQTEGFTGNEFSIRMRQLKRQYVNTKYNLNSKQKNNFIHRSTSLPANCINEDFEASPAGPITATNQINGWTVDAGSNDPLLNPGANSCNLIGCCPTAPAESQIITIPPTGYIDPVIGGNYPIYSVFGTTPNNGAAVNPSITSMFGNNVIRINSQVNNYSIERLTKTINITPANSLFKFAFISVYATGHNCCDGGALQILLFDAATNSLIACPNFTAAAPSAQCVSTNTSISYYNAPTGTPYVGVGNVIYNKWQVNSFDLSQYIGHTLTIQIIASDCIAGGHYGYAYIDASCAAQPLVINGTPNGGGNFTICDPIFSYYTADSYLWNGPAGSGITNVTTPTINVTTSGFYTLTTLNNGCSNPVTQILNLTLIPPPSVTISATSASICPGGSAVLTASVSGATSFSWSTGSSLPSIIVSPTISSVYSVTANYFGSCAHTATAGVTVELCDVGLNENKNDQGTIFIYPNSIQENVTLTATNVLMKEIKISNSIGQLVYSTTYENVVTTTIDCSKFSSGIYFVTLTTNKGRQTKKIIKE
jgi:hypothetical protein